MQFLIDSITIEQRKTYVSYASNDIKPTRQTIPLNRNRIIVLPTMVNKTERVFHFLLAFAIRTTSGSSQKK